MTGLRTLFAAAVLAAAIGCGGQRTEGVRLYVLDGGTLHVSDPARFQLRKEDVAETNFAVACYLITHPKGTLLWDACAVPDSEWTPTGSPVKHHLVLPDSQERDITLVRPLGSAASRRGLLAGEHHPPGALALSLRSHGQCEHVCQSHVARDRRPSAMRCLQARFLV